MLVLDTNALRHGQFSIPALRAWIRAVGEGADVVIPQVVIWEWAEHAAAAHTRLAGQLDEFKADPALYARPMLVDPLPLDELIRKMRELLPRPARVYTHADSAYKQAVMDQVLQTGPAERKDGVKTGAADSLLQECLAAQLEDRRGTEAVILATGDKGLKRACTAEFGEDVLIVSSTRELLQKLYAFVPAQEDLLEEAETALWDRVRDASSDIGSALRAFDMGYRIQVSDRAPSTVHDVPVRDLARLGRLDLLELHDLQVSASDDGNRIGLADVRIFADVHMTQLELRPSANGTSEWRTSYDGTISHGFIDIRVAVTWNQHWELVTVEPTGEAVLVFDTSDYDDLDDVAPFHADGPAPT